ncbi:GGDEF domain-containing protein [Campylobacter sp.]|uniref:GGDEF domain-containing protein n=1 Tax=Campylobacter sp. TaxID=205 RepID=UPI0026F6AFB1|nr:diguanylate cyclase [Campylobacter sp.]
MSTKINKIIRDTISAMKERNLILTPDNYSDVFCEIAKKNGVVVPDCQKLEKYVSRLNSDFQEELKSKRVKNLDELFAFMSSRLNSSASNDSSKLANALSLMSKRILQAAAILHNKEARKLSDMSIEALNRKLDLATVERVKDKWFEFLTDYDDSFFKRLNSYGVRNFDDIESIVVELDNSLMRSYDNAYICNKFIPVIISTLIPSISDQMDDEISAFELNLKSDPKSLQQESIQESIKKLTKKRIELDRAEVASKVSVLNEVLEDINKRVGNLISSSVTGSSKMQVIKNDLNLINLKEDSFEGIRSKLIAIAESLDIETKELGNQMSSNQKTIKELQDRVNKLEGELENVKAESKEDFLTKAATKRALMEELERTEEVYRRFGTDYSICFFDIDHFKNINDTYGHEAGDVIIASVGKMLRRYSRKIDFIGRYGGEEFVIMLPQTPPANSVKFANKVRKIIETSKFMYKDERISVTISCGVAVRSENTSLTSTLETADKMLYAAKQAGRNLVMPKTDEA